MYWNDQPYYWPVMMDPLSFPTQHSEELSAALAAVKVHQSQLQAVCGHLISLPAAGEELDYTRLAQEAEDEIMILLKRVSQHCLSKIHSHASSWYFADHLHS